MIRRLRIKFICINMLIAFILLTALFGAIIIFTNQTLSSATDAFMQEVAENPMRSLVPEDDPDIARLPFFIIEIDNDGGMNVINGGNFDLDDDEMLTELRNQAGNENGFGTLPDYSLKYYQMTTPQMRRIVFIDSTGVGNMMTNLVKHSLIMWACGLAAFFVISVLLANWAIKPVDEAWKKQRQFVSDASHELRTPLTLIALNAELISGSDSLKDPKLISEVDNISQGVERMKQLTENLLELARADNGTVKVQMAKVNISHVIEMGALTFEALLLEKGQLLETDITPELTVYGDSGQLGQLISIFLDNAHKYGNPDSTVRVSLKPNKRGGCTLCVSNIGTPISRENLERLFDRFFRMDEARTSKGYGLGLAIAREIANTHKAKIWAESTVINENKGAAENSSCPQAENSFYVSFPRIK